MNRRSLLKNLSLVAALAALSPLPATSQSAEVVAGVRYEPIVQVGSSRLLLNGAGVRYKAIFKVYAAGLYLPARASTPEAVQATTGPRRLHVVMLRDIDANELGKLFTQGMEKNTTREEFGRSINGTLRLAELFSRRKRLMPGDTFDVDWLPGSGTGISINGHSETEPVKEPEFFHALLSIWLGKAPADDALKDALLGRSPSRAFGV
jgi:hypothetical protein